MMVISSNEAFYLQDGSDSSIASEEGPFYLSAVGSLDIGNCLL